MKEIYLISRVGDDTPFEVRCVVPLAGIPSSDTPLLKEKLDRTPNFATQPIPAKESRGTKDRNLTVFVGNIPNSCTEEKLKQFFTAAGFTSISHVQFNKKYGFITLGSEAERTKAIATLNGTQLLGQKIVVATPK